MTQNNMQIEFDSLIPNKNLDPTGNTMRKILSYLGSPLGGHRLFARNGALFSLKPQWSDGEKEFLANVPSCSGTSSTDIRNWYFCFRLEANATTRFTYGDDTDLEQFDIPGKFRVLMDYWTTQIWSALSKSHVFPANSPIKMAVETNWSKGYDALRAIIVPNQSLVIEQPSVLIRETPKQLESHSICSYFSKYVDFLVLRVFIEDNPNNIDTKGEMDKFLSGLTHYDVLNSMCRQERRSGDPKLEQKYTQGQIMTTLTTFLQALGKHDVVPLPKASALPHVKSLSFKHLTSSCQRPTASIHSITAASVT